MSRLAARHTYGRDADHFIIITRPLLDQGKTYKCILVYITGTTDHPELLSCLLKYAAEFVNIMVIGVIEQRG